MKTPLPCKLCKGPVVDGRRYHYWSKCHVIRRDAKKLGWAATLAPPPNASLTFAK